MEEQTSQQYNDDNVNEDLYPPDEEKYETKMQNELVNIDSETDGDLASPRKTEIEPDFDKRTDNNSVLFFQEDDDVNVCVDEIPSCSSSGGKDDEGNLLSSVVTMHNMTNCDDDYSPTLAICDIFNKSKDSPTKSVAPILQSKEDENKDEFLIIDLDTCQMERAAKNVNETQSKKRQRSNSPSKDFVFVNLSAQDDAQPDFLNNSNNNDDNNNESNNSENNFLLNSKDDGQRPDPKMSKSKEKPNEKSAIKDEISSQVCENKCLRQFKLLSTDADIKRENCLQDKGVLFQDVSMPDEPIVSKEVYSGNVGFHSNELSDDCFNSNDNQETEPAFYMPELYSRHYEDDKNDPSPTFTKLATHNSRLESDNGDEFYEYTINDGASFDTPLSSTPYTTNSNDFYDQPRVQNANQYNFESKIISNLLAMETKDTSTPYGSRHPENTYCFKNRVSATVGSNKYSPYSTNQEHATSPFFNPPFRPTYRATYPYNNLQQTPDVNSQLIPSSASNYSDWNSWSSSSLYEVNLNTFSSVHNSESQCPQVKEDWCNDAVMNDLYHDPEMSIKSSQAEIDSEATEDADETDDVPIYFEDPAEFSTCDNLSTISVMSSSCYSDTSSVMAPMSPSDFTPPPSVSNTPMSSNHDMNVPDEQQCSYPFTNDNTRSEPLHLYSPTMLSVAPYKITNEKCEPNLMSYGRSQGIKHYYPSMADMHNSRSGFPLSGASSKFETGGMLEFPDYRKTNKNQIQSDKISTSTTRNACNKKNKDIENYANQPLETYAYYIKQEDNDLQNESRRLRHNEPLRQTAIRIMSQWYETHLENPYPTKEDKMQMARDGGITITQVKSWFANKRNRTNNTKPKVQKRAMKEKLKKLFQDLKHSRSDSIDNSHIIQQLSGIIQT